MCSGVDKMSEAVQVDVRRLKGTTSLKKLYFFSVKLLTGNS